MPFPNYHACRLQNPDGFRKGRFRNITRGRGENEVQLIIGVKQHENTMTTQSIRFPVNKWTEDRARRRCMQLKGQFEAAK